MKPRKYLHPLRGYSFVNPRQNCLTRDIHYSNYAALEAAVHSDGDLVNADIPHPTDPNCVKETRKAWRKLYRRGFRIEKVTLSLGWQKRKSK